MNDQRAEALQKLFRAIVGLQSVEECGAFLEDLCTVRELEDMARRLDAAEMLSKGEAYLTVAREVGISTATISRVSRALNYGSGGYKTVLDWMAGEAEA